MDSLSRDLRALLTGTQEPPCISLYLPTHRHGPENLQDPIRFRNLIKEAGVVLEKKYPAVDTESLLAPLRELSEDKDFWNRSLDGLLVLKARGMFRTYRLQGEAEERVSVDDRFLIKPLLRSLQSTERYQVLAIDQQSARLYEGNRDTIDEVEFEPGAPRTIEDALGDELTEPFKTAGSYGSGPSGSRAVGSFGSGVSSAAMYHGQGSRKDEVEIDTERFFRAVDQWVAEHRSRPSRLPLVLAALGEHHKVFHKVSKNPLLIEGGIVADPFALSLDELRARAWGALELRRSTMENRAIERFGTAKSDERASGDISELAHAAAAGRIGTLLLETGRRVEGTIDRETGSVEYSDDGDMLDDLAEMVLRHGGDVLVVSSQHIPSASGAAGTYRF